MGSQFHEGRSQLSGIHLSGILLEGLWLLWILYIKKLVRTYVGFDDTMMDEAVCRRIKSIPVGEVRYFHGIFEYSGRG